MTCKNVFNLQLKFNGSLIAQLKRRYLQKKDIHTQNQIAGLALKFQVQVVNFKLEVANFCFN
jgi:hypothetical protein